MTTVRSLRRSDLLRMRVDGKLLWAVLVCLVSALPMQAQDRPVHWLNAGAMPPGAIGRQRLLRGGPLSGYCQPVEIWVPQGAWIAPVVGTGFSEAKPDRLLVGLQIGPVYRMKVTNLPNHPGLELFPTVELVDRLDPPPGQALRFPIPVELTQSELVMAAEGHFVTRVIYLEDPTTALPIANNDTDGRWFEARPGNDPLIMADQLGRPMAILRIGGRVPDAGNPNDDFLYGAPPALVYDQQARPPRKQ